MNYDIAEIPEVRDVHQFLEMMQDLFEETAGSKPFFRITATPVELGDVAASLESKELKNLLENPPNPHGRVSGWDVKPFSLLKRNALGFETDRPDFHHLKFIKNGHLEFWTAIDQYFCWRQDVESRRLHPELYPYAVVEHPVSFVRLYRALADLLPISSEIVFQMQYVNIKGAILKPYQPESIAYMYPVVPVRPNEKNRLVFEKKRVPPDFAADPTALLLISDLYYEFGYSREGIPFFDEHGNSKL